MSSVNGRNIDVRNNISLRFEEFYPHLWWERLPLISQTQGTTFPTKPTVDITKRQELRQARFKKLCSTWNETFVSPNTFKFLLLDVKHKVIYAEIPKVASSNWLHVMINMTNMVHVDFVNRTNNKFNFLSRRFLNAIGLRYMKRMFVKEAESTLKMNIYKFVFVRHPFERLVSAFKSKINPGNIVHRHRDGAAILRMFRPDAPFIRHGKGVKFHEFVRWILHLDRTHQHLDEHWCPYYRLCHACQVHYDFIGKYETLDTDAAEVMRQAYNVTNFTFPNETKQHKTGVGGSVTAAYFKGVSPEDKHKLKDLYRYDFELFGYNPDLY